MREYGGKEERGRRAQGPGHDGGDSGGDEGVVVTSYAETHFSPCSLAKHKFELEGGGDGRLVEQD